MAYFKLKGMERGASRAEWRTLPLWGHVGLLGLSLPPSMGQWTPVCGEGTGVGDRAVLEQSRRRLSPLHGGPWTGVGRLVCPTFLCVAVIVV